MSIWRVLEREMRNVGKVLDQANGYADLRISYTALAAVAG